MIEMEKSPKRENDQAEGGYSLGRREDLNKSREDGVDRGAGMDRICGWRGVGLGLSWSGSGERHRWTSG